MKKYVDWDKIEEETVSAEEACECTRSKLQSWIDFVVDLFPKKKGTLLLRGNESRGKSQCNDN